MDTPMPAADLSQAETTFHHMSLGLPASGISFSLESNQWDNSDGFTPLGTSGMSVDGKLDLPARCNAMIFHQSFSHQTRARADDFVMISVGEGGETEMLVD
jgi:hypothetical protein